MNANDSAPPRVSVVTIFLDAERFMEEAIQSVLDQTYESWELLLVDDGSTDGSTEIARRYAAAHPKIRYLEHEGHRNLGMSASRNLGIDSARGEFIAFLDADDIYLPEKLERQVALLEAMPDVAMVYGPTLRWYSWTGEETDRQQDRCMRLGVIPDTTVLPPRIATLIVRRRADSPGTCSVLIRKTVLEEVGGAEPRFRGIFEDQVLFIKVLLHAPVHVMSGSWDRYRQHPDGCCNQMQSTGRYAEGRPNPARRTFLDWAIEYASTDVSMHEEFRKAVRAELRRYRYPRFYAVYMSILKVCSRGIRQRLVRRARRESGNRPAAENLLGRSDVPDLETDQA
jgi:glycosyltransferase involved in cell wall biosynthesis